MDFNKEYVFEDDVVMLRLLKPEDVTHLYSFAIEEPTLWQYSLLPANGKENMDIYFQFAFEQLAKQTSYPFIVYDKRRKEYAGSTRFYDFSKVHATTQLGYTWYGTRFWGTGLNKHCKYLLLEFAFEQLNLERVEFRADNNNARSIAAMKSIGCTVEGVLRNNCQGPDCRRDSIVLSILKKEWFERVKHDLSQKCQG